MPNNLLESWFLIAAHMFLGKRESEAQIPGCQALSHQSCRQWIAGRVKGRNGTLYGPCVRGRAGPALHRGRLGPLLHELLPIRESLPRKLCVAVVRPIQVTQSDEKVEDHISGNNAVRRKRQ